MDAESVISWVRARRVDIVRWITSAEVGTSTDDFIACVVYDDGAIGGERAWAALLEECFVCLSMVR
jgi:hypothetical protein